MFNGTFYDMDMVTGPVTGPLVVRASAAMFFVFFVICVTKKQAWKQKFWKQLGFSTLWLLLLCVSSVFVYGNYEDARGMIFKNAMTSHDNVTNLRLDIDSGINVDITDEKGITPLMYSVYCNSVPNVRFLLGRGANPDVKDNYGNSASDRANERKNPEMMALFR